MKKRLVSILLALVLVLSLLPVLPVFAADYDLYLCGIQVTDSNKDDIFHDGRAQYIPEYNQLNIRGNFASPNTIIESGIDGLVISARTHTYETVTLTSTTKDVIVLRGSATITGSYLDLQPTGTGGQESAIYAKGGTLTIKDSTLKANGDYTIYGTGVTTSLKIQNSNVTATTNDSSGTAVGSFNGGITLVEARITKPVGGKVNATGDTIVTSSNTMAHEVEITAGDAYDLWLDCTQVTSANALNPLGDGTFQFYAPKTLYIKDNYSATGPVIENGIEGLIILTDSGSYTLTSADSDVITTTASMTFQYANLNLVSEGPGTQDCAVFVDAKDKTLTFDGCNMELSADWTVFAQFGSNNDKLVIKNSDLKINSTVTAVRNFKAGITLENCYIESPAGATYDGESIMDGSSVAENVVIKKGTDPGVKYDLWVEGTQVTDMNKNDITGGGFYKYDPASNVLTVKGHTFASGSNNIVTNYIPGLTIMLAGDSILSGPANGFYSTVDMTVDGNGHKLTLTNSSNSCAAIYLLSDSATPNTLTVKNLAEGSKINGYWGIVGENHREELIIDNCQVTIDTTQAAVSDFDEGITINGWGIISPEGAYVDGDKIVDKYGAMATNIIIGDPSSIAKTYELRIENVQVTDDNKNDVLGNGCFAYDPASNVLTIKKGYDSSTGYDLIDNYIEGLTIKLEANATLKGNGNGIYTEKSLTVDGNGKKLNMDVARGGIYIYVNGSDSTLKLTNIAGGTISGKWGVCGDNLDEKLIINHCSFTATGTDGAIVDFDRGIELVGCEIVDPVGGVVQNDDVFDGEGGIATSVTINSTELYNPFVDVIKGKFYYDAVLWAYYATPQITNGMDATHFAPEDTCKRSHIVTFLWRAKGCPEPTMTESPFTDVTNKSAFYYKAVLWAVENGITAGKSPTTFAPDAGCKRSEVVTFLWRAEGKPAPAKTENPFNDVKSGTFYYDAVLWAYHHTPQITNGMDMAKGLFGTDNTCTRGQIATFLKRTIAPEA